MTGMRVIESTWERTAVQLGHLTPEHQEKILQALEEGIMLRSSTASDKYGQQTHSITLVAYTSPLGVGRRAIVQHIPEGSEIVDFDDDADAEAHYEAQVRELAVTSEGPGWDASDVAGVALAPYAWTRWGRVPGGEWECVERGRARFGEEIDDGRWARPTSLEEVAETRLELAADRQAKENVFAALCQALGMTASSVVYDAVRVEVTGDDTGHGERTVTVECPVALHTPTEDEVADFRRAMAQIYDEQQREAQEEFYAYAG
ncbi:hypothetical protein PS9374_04457 [Planomonospora sphaerica]|uniref:Uncharacterized protein n=2 Tax=Planomonospora sphaerica TaxID=161355 RepID=A0A171DIT7_9ACTN|nr:hypothetical protein PS9374_04457 [Planomonospora sphaerica]